MTESAVDHHRAYRHGAFVAVPQSLGDTTDRADSESTGGRSSRVDLTWMMCSTVLRSGLVLEAQIPAVRQSCHDGPPSNKRMGIHYTRLPKPTNPCGRHSRSRYLYYHLRIPSPNTATAAKPGKVPHSIMSALCREQCSRMHCGTTVCE